MELNCVLYTVQNGAHYGNELFTIDHKVKYSVWSITNTVQFTKQYSVHSVTELTALPFRVQ